MSQPDDLDKLLREIDGMNKPAVSGGASTPATRPSDAVQARGKQPVAKQPSGGGRLAWTGASAIGGGVLGGVLGTVLTFLPAMSTLSTAVGAAIGGAVVGFVSGPPRWFDSE
jgi:hypothetical protein